VRPEHALLQSLTPSSNVYSLGCVAFEMLTGERWAMPQNRVAFADSLRQRSDEIREVTTIEQIRCLQVRVTAAETKSETLQRLNVDLTSQMRRLREKTLPRLTLIAGVVDLGVGLAAKWAANAFFGSTNETTPLRSDHPCARLRPPSGVRAPGPFLMGTYL
jgi:serine/threonine protein kinase